MAAMKISKVHVFSFIPGVAEVFQKNFPKLDVCSIAYESNNDSAIYEKAVTKNELSQLQEATILITDNHLLSQVYHKLPNLLWAQLSYAGIERLTAKVKESTVKPAFQVSRCASFNQPMAEYVIAWIINHSRNFIQLDEMQEKKIWARNMSQLPSRYPSLKDFTVGIAGVGEIGNGVAGYLKAFNVRVLGYGRSSNARSDVKFDSYWYGNQLPEFLAECDYVVSILPSTPETIGLYAGDTLKHAKKKPVFINVGRGSVISNADVITALDNGWISMAILDVFTEEPLPTTDPLWEHPKVLITPHLAASTTAQDILNTFKENMERINNNEPLKYRVDWDKGY